MMDFSIKNDDFNANIKDIVALASRPELVLLRGSAVSLLSANWTQRYYNPAAYDCSPACHTAACNQTCVAYRPNPQSSCVNGSLVLSGAVGLCEQQLVTGGGFATAWQRLKPEILLVALSNSVPAGVRRNESCTVLATKAIESARLAGEATLISEHIKWWIEGFWPRSMLSVPDAMVEGFHTIQMYKLGSATHCDEHSCWAMDLAMPWWASSRWPDYHWDLNVQMSYWLQLPSNHAQHGMSLVRMMQRNLDVLKHNVPPQFQNDSMGLTTSGGFQGAVACNNFGGAANISGRCYLYTPPVPANITCAVRDHKPDCIAVQIGQLTWVAHNLWWQYRYSLDPEALDTTVSILKPAIAYYMRLMVRDADGTLHLPRMESPEYCSASDTNYDLSLFRWGAGTLILIADRIRPALQRDPAYSKWYDVVTNLTPYPVDSKTGLLVGINAGRGVELDSPYRHWSHMFSLFPLALKDPSLDVVALKSLDHFARNNGADLYQPKAANGFPAVAISIMSSMVPGREQAAYQNVSNWLILGAAANDGRGGGAWMPNFSPSTMYQEANGSPCNESPLGAAFAYQSLLLSSFDFRSPEMRTSDVLRVFPAVPPIWATASIGSLSAEGGYNISASYADHKTVWVHITATVLGSTRNATIYTDMAPPLVTTPSSIVPKFVNKLGKQNLYSLQLAPGQGVLLQPAGSTPKKKAVVRAVAWDPIEGVDVTNFWGKHRREALPCPANSGRHGICRALPVPVPPPPPLPPPPPPVTCASKAAPEGYDCFDHRCAFDGEPVKIHCGGDICTPYNNLVGKKESVKESVTTAALCSLVPGTHNNASEIAAARCSAYDGCHSFASCPQYLPGRCNGSKKTGGGDGVCYKFFRSTAANFTVATGWTMWTQTNSRVSIKSDDTLDNTMGARQQLLMAAYSQAALAKGPPAACSQAEVFSWMYTLSAGNTTAKTAVLAHLAALPSRCPDFLLPMIAGFAGSSSCALMRVYGLASNATRAQALPLASKLVIGRALLNMTNNPTTGSLWAFVTRRQNDAMEIDNSENLDLANKIPVSLALEIIAELPAPEFGPQLRLPDGRTVAEHSAAWSTYWRSYFTSRALWGINVETSSTSYAKYFIEELACIHDLTRSASLRSLVSDYMQVYFADAATEYISNLGVRGGAKSRCYHDYYSLNDGDPLGMVGWLLGWTGNTTTSNGRTTSYVTNTFGYYFVHIAATSWRPLPQLTNIAQANSNGEHNEPFTYTSHRLGRSADVGGDAGANSNNLEVCKRDGGPRGAMEAGICYFLNVTEPSLLRQTYVTPEFMLGTLTFDPKCNYTAISSQNNVMGAVFSGSTADRLVFGGTGMIESGKHGGYPLGTEFLSLSAVQVGPAAVLQRPLDAQASNGSYVFISGALPHRGRPPLPGEGLLPSLHRTIEGWWCFHDTNGWQNDTKRNNASYGCVRLVGNEMTTTNFTVNSHDASDSRGGILLLPSANMWSPTVVQLARAADYENFATFVETVRRLPVLWSPTTGHFRFTTLNGSTVETWAQSTRLPLVDGAPIHPPGAGFSGPVYSGPYLSGGGSDGTVEITHPAVGAATLDFRRRLTKTDDNTEWLPVV